MTDRGDLYDVAKLRRYLGEKFGLRSVSIDYLSKSLHAHGYPHSARSLLEWQNGVPPKPATLERLRDFERRVRAGEIELDPPRRPGRPSRTAAAPARKQVSLKVRRMRERLGLSRRELGELVGVSHVTIFNWESKGFEPRPHHMDRLRSLEAELPAKDDIRANLAAITRSEMIDLLASDATKDDLLQVVRKVVPGAEVKPAIRKKELLAVLANVAPRKALEAALARLLGG